MTFAILFAWLLALPGVPDSAGRPIARPEAAARAIATVALEAAVSDPAINAQVLASTLDVIGARESHYSTHPRGSNDHGVSKGFGQTPRAETPDDLLGQVRVAAKWIVVSWRACPEHPLSRYATGTYCGRVRIADEYWRIVRAELAVPIQNDATQSALVLP